MPEAEKTEKITINLGYVDLGQIDLLVREGFYANRTDFIRTAVRNQLATAATAVDQTVARRTLVLGTAPTPAASSRKRARRAGWSRSACWVWPPSPTTSPPSLRWRRSSRSRCSARCGRVRAVKAALAPRTV